MTEVTLAAVLSLGFILGLRHALDPDHVVAVSTIVSESKSVKRSSLVGTFWGLGHTMSLLLVGIIVIAFRVRISERLALWLELGVAVMLVFLGVRTALRPLRGWRVHVHRHTHDGNSHIHIHMHRPGEAHLHQHRHLLGVGARPFFVGMVHGLAGSASLMFLVLATIPSAVTGLLYIAVFGLGSVGGMFLMSSLISLPFALTSKRFGAVSQGLTLIAGLSSLAFGLFLVWEYVVHERLIF